MNRLFIHLAVSVIGLLSIVCSATGGASRAEAGTVARVGVEYVRISRREIELLWMTTRHDKTDTPAHDAWLAQTRNNIAEEKLIEHLRAQWIRRGATERLSGNPTATYVDEPLRKRIGRKSSKFENFSEVLSLANPGYWFFRLMWLPWSPPPVFKEGFNTRKFQKSHSCPTETAAYRVYARELEAMGVLEFADTGFRAYFFAPGLSETFAFADSSCLSMTRAEKSSKSTKKRAIDPKYSCESHPHEFYRVEVEMVSETRAVITVRYRYSPPEDSEVYLSVKARQNGRELKGYGYRPGRLFKGEGGAKMTLSYHGWLRDSFPVVTEDLILGMYRPKEQIFCDTVIPLSLVWGGETKRFAYESPSVSRLHGRTE